MTRWENEQTSVLFESSIIKVMFLEVDVCVFNIYEYYHIESTQLHAKGSYIIIIRYKHRATLGSYKN